MPIQIGLPAEPAWAVAEPAPAAVEVHASILRKNCSMPDMTRAAQPAQHAQHAHAAVKDC
jgi:hypothetical protein